MDEKVTLAVDVTNPDEFRKHFCLAFVINDPDGACASVGEDTSRRSSAA